MRGQKCFQKNVIGSLHLSIFTVQIISIQKIAIKIRLFAFNFSNKSTTSIDTIESETSSGGGSGGDDDSSNPTTGRPPPSPSTQTLMMTRSATYSAIQTDI